MVKVRGMNTKLNKSLWNRVVAVSFGVLCIFSQISWMGEASAAQSSSGGSASGTAIGMMLGEPTGITGKYWVTSEAAIDAGAGFSFGDYFVIYSDYLVHMGAPAVSTDSDFFKIMDVYLGGGASIMIAGDGAKREKRGFTNEGVSTLGFGLRVPIGAEWRMSNPALAPFVEIVPGFGLAPKLFLFYQACLGMRVYF
jgi:hypothetical protein